MEYVSPLQRTLASPTPAHHPAQPPPVFSAPKRFHVAPRLWLLYLSPLLAHRPYFWVDSRLYLLLFVCSVAMRPQAAEEKALQRHLAEVEREQAVEQGTAAQRAENDRLADDLHGHVEEMERDRDAKVQQGAPTYFVQMVPKEAEPPFVMLEPDKDESEAESDLEDENAVKREGPAEDGQDDKVKKLIEKDGFDYRVWHVLPSLLHSLCGCGGVRMRRCVAVYLSL